MRLYYKPINDTLFELIQNAVQTDVYLIRITIPEIEAVDVTNDDVAYHAQETLNVPA